MEDVENMVRTTISQIEKVLSSKTVIGEPITAGKVTLIPVSKVSIGFAAGGAGKDDKAGSGAGTGGGVSVTPIAFISIIDDRVQVHPVTKDLHLGRILSLAPELVQKIAKFLKRDDEEKKDKHDAPGSAGGEGP